VSLRAQGGAPDFAIFDSFSRKSYWEEHTTLNKVRPHSSFYNSNRIRGEFGKILAFTKKVGISQRNFLFNVCSGIFLKEKHELSHEGSL